MKTYITELQAIDPKDGELKKWGGDRIEADTIEEAEMVCQMEGKGYLKVLGELEIEIEARLRPII